MFLHRKELIQPVNVGTPDARFGTYLLEQFGGATGELTAALQYWVQSFHVENAGIRDMLQDIAIEEFRASRRTNEHTMQRKGRA
jgi:Mn-containing catalase